MVRLIDWGKSMYGGYYANLLDEGTGEAWTSELFYISADTYGGLCKLLAFYGLKAERAKRFDN